MAQLKDLTNFKTEYLTVISKAESRNKHVYWTCLCHCGNLCEFSSESLTRPRKGKPLHCGCLDKKKNDLIGKRFDRLTVIEKTDKRKNKSVIWKCKCDCGNFIEAPTHSLVTKHLRSCGCLFQETHRIDITNQHFGLLKALKVDEQDGNRWICECACGNICSINGYNLRAGKTKSCGCINYSIGEKNIKAILDQANISYIKEYTCSDLHQKRFDFAILENNQIVRFIEFDGEQHYKDNRGTWDKDDSLEQRQKRDQEKNEYALSHHIPLIRIPYWERDNITLEMIFSSKYEVVK